MRTLALAVDSVWADPDLTPPAESLPDLDTGIRGVAEEGATTGNPLNAPPMRAGFRSAGCHSERNATIASTRMARRAGT